MNDDEGGRTIIVLGMHRSGTSALTGSLEQAGLALGPVIESAPDNVRGSRESRRLMALHDDVLARNGGSWREPVANPRWEPVHRELRDSVVEGFRGIPLWGFKDPRTLLVLQGWLSALPSAELVGIFRHPFLVADSLHRRDGMPHAEGLSLWSYYNRILLWYHERRGGFPLLEFSTSPGVFRDGLDALATSLGLDAERMRFFDETLRHVEPPELGSVAGAPQARALFDKLVDRARK